MNNFGARVYAWTKANPGPRNFFLGFFAMSLIKPLNPEKRARNQKIIDELFKVK